MILLLLFSILALQSILAVNCANFTQELGLNKKPFTEDIYSQQNCLHAECTNSLSSPPKYFAYDYRMGRINNQIQTFVAALYWSERINRTLIFPGWDEHNCLGRKRITYGQVAFEKYFDLAHILRSGVKMVSAFDYNSKILPTLGEKDKVLRKDIPFSRFHKKFTPESLVSTLSSVGATHLEVGIPYRWTVPEEDVLRIMSYLKLRRELRDVGDSWIRNNLLRPYAAVHLRRWEGKCTMPLSHVMSYIDGSSRTKQMKSFFLATDGQDPEDDSKFIEKYNPKIFSNKTMVGIYSEGLVDSYILSMSNLFFANHFSSLSYNSYMSRKAICSAKTGIFSLITDEPDLQICRQDFSIVLLKPLNEHYKC